mmetsp:Transcript_18824/g.47063  ORF Transcript_18824/g.47063 Transcript_18824/m.47063 type:complete len:281 (+) Transcript_18824:101-943(+)
MGLCPCCADGQGASGNESFWDDDEDEEEFDEDFESQGAYDAETSGYGFDSTHSGKGKGKKGKKGKSGMSGMSSMPSDRGSTSGSRNTRGRDSKGKGKGGIKSRASSRSGRDQDDYFDQVNLVNHATGRVVAKGDKGVRNWIASEKKLRTKWGDMVYFNCFRMNRDARKASDVQIRLHPKKPGYKSEVPSEGRDKVIIPAEEIPPRTTVAQVKKMLRTTYMQEQGVEIRANERMTFYIDFLMEDQQYFWEDYPIVLPLFVTAWVHEGSLEDLKRWMAKIPR